MRRSVVALMIIAVLLAACGNKDTAPVESVKTGEDIKELSPGIYVDNGFACLNITDHICEDTGTELFLDKEGIMLSLGLSERLPSDDELEQYRKAAASMDLLFDEYADHVILYNDRKDIFLCENATMYLMNGEPRFFEHPVIKSNGRLEIPFTNLVFAMGFTGYDQDRNGEVTIYRLTKEEDTYEK